jgi:sporulation domain-containing protein
MSKSSIISVNVPAYEGNYTKGRSGRNIEAITLHHMAGRLTADQCGRIFQAKGRYGSSHYGVGYDGSIASYVDEDDTAWTNSNWDSNCKSITIEISDNDNSWYVNDITLNAVIKLVADVANRRELGTLVPGKNLTWHSMFANTTCPGDYLRSKMQYIADEANKINSEEPIKEKTTEELAREVIEGKYGNGEDRKNALGDRYVEVQARVNEILTPAPKPNVDILDLVRKTIRGDFGNGEDRKQALGSNYEEVQRQVNLNIQNGTTNWDNVRLY